MFKAYSSKRAALRGAIRNSVPEDAVYQDVNDQWGFDIEDPAAEPDAQASEAVEIAAAVEQFQVAALEAPAQPAPKHASSPTGRKIQKDRPEANGVKMPSEGTLCRAVWDFCDHVASSEGVSEVTAKVIKQAAQDKGWNPNNATIEYYNWRKFHGITGRQAK